MRLPLALGVCVCVAIALAPLTDGDPGTPGGDEAGSLASLRSAGITYATPDGAINFDKAVCVSMGNGELGPRWLTN